MERICQPGVKMLLLAAKRVFTRQQFLQGNKVRIGQDNLPHCWECNAGHPKGAESHGAGNKCLAGPWLLPPLVLLSALTQAAGIQQVMLFLHHNL